jgi:hypothetical protein
MWTTNVNNWEDVSEKSYQLILSEADKALKDISEDSEKTTTRVYNIITVLIVLFSAVISGMIKSFSDANYYKLSIPLFIVSVVLAIATYNMYKLIKPRGIFRIGTEPEIIFTSRNFDVPGDSDDDKIKRVYINIIEQYQEKIVLNEEINKNRISDFNEALQLIFYSLFGLVIVIATFMFCTIIF